MKRCPVCERFTLAEFEKPIKYWVCYNCGDVFVIDTEGLVACLDHATLRLEGYDK